MRLVCNSHGLQVNRREDGSATIEFVNGGFCLAIKPDGDRAMLVAAVTDEPQDWSKASRVSLD